MFISEDLKLLNTTHCILALVINTFSLLSPPSLFKGPKFIDNLPFKSLPYPTLINIISLSSPWIFSRFFTKKPSFPDSLKYCSNSGCFLSLSSKTSKTVFLCLILNVPTPILRELPYFLTRSNAYSTRFSASLILLEPEPR